MSSLGPLGFCVIKKGALIKMESSDIDSLEHAARFLPAPFMNRERGRTRTKTAWSPNFFV